MPDIYKRGIREEFQKGIDLFGEENLELKCTACGEYFHWKKLTYAGKSNNGTGLKFWLCPDHNTEEVRIQFNIK